MGAGRPPKPTALKELAGNPGKRQLGKGEPQPERLAEIPRPPASLNRWGKQLWRETGQELVELGVITRVDLASWEMCCLHYGEAVEVRRQIRKDGMTTKDEYGAIRKHPLFTVLHQASALFSRYAARFGLDPSGRSKLSLGQGDEATTIADLLDAAIHGDRD